MRCWGLRRRCVERDGVNLDRRLFNIADICQCQRAFVLTQNLFVVVVIIIVIIIVVVFIFFLFLVFNIIIFVVIVIIIIFIVVD